MPDNHQAGQPQNKRTGRPLTKFTDDQVRQIEVMAGYGIPEGRIAHVLGISPDTLYRHKVLRPEIAKAIARGRAVQETKIGRALARKAESGDMAAIRWYEMTRAGRRATTDVTTAGAPMTGVTYVIQSAAGELIEEGP